jgi:hypothetical protein
MVSALVQAALTIAICPKRPEGPEKAHQRFYDIPLSILAIPVLLGRVQALLGLLLLFLL